MKPPRTDAIEHVQANQHPDMGIIYISSAILLLALATLVIRYGSFKLPSGQADARG